MIHQRDNTLTASPRRGPLAALLGLFSNVWFGIALATILFVYCSIGSAIPTVRQHPLIEQTEFEWFHWWPFNACVILFAVTLTVVTIRRIPFRPVNYGVWMIHTGILVLTFGSYYYFTTKVEGDAPVFRRRVQIELPDGSTHLVAIPGSRTSLRTGEGTWQFQVQSTNSAWPILSDPHKGKRTYAVNVAVTPPEGDMFIRQLLDGYPQYTEDILPGKGRAVKATGKPLLREDLELAFALEPQTHFHVMKSWALFVRRAGEKSWRERPIEDLPRYNEYIGSRDQVFLAPGTELTLRALDLPVQTGAENDPLAGADVRITGYLPYAHWERRWREGGDQLNPVLRARFIGADAGGSVVELVALDANRRRDEQGLTEFIWLDDRSQIDRIPKDSAARLTIRVPDASLEKIVSLIDTPPVGPDGPYQPLEGTDFAYRVRSVQDGLVLPGGQGAVSIAIVDVKTPDGEFTRWVSNRPGMTRDLSGESADPHGMGGGMTEKLDPRIKMDYDPQSAPIVFAAYPGGIHMVVNSPEGRRFESEVAVGIPVEVVPGLHVQVDSLMTRASVEEKPFIVPPTSRQREAGELYAMIRLEIDAGGGRQVQWVPFHQYALPDARYAYPGRFAYAPSLFRDQRGQPIEVVFSRRRQELPHPVALETFELDTHVGGYSGQASTIRNYISRLRFLRSEQWTDARPIQVNDPTEFGGFWYFQSMWDRPSVRDPQGGLNYTGLGIGNRNGVYIQLLGCCLSVIGMAYAFYVKPIIRRRRSAAQQQKINTKVTATTAHHAAPVEEAAVS